MSYNNYFIPVMLSAALKMGKPYGSFINGLPVVLFRGQDGQIKAFEDACPHRGAKLSDGRLKGGDLECPYHGWRFNEAGSNTLVPVKNGRVSCTLKSVHAIESFGIVWLSCEPNSILPVLNTAYANLVFSGSIEATLANALENFLEGSHTHFVHNGFIRSREQKRQKVKARLEPGINGFSVRYEQEPAKGILTKLLPKRYRVLSPVVTYIFPFTAILEYYNGEKLIFRAETILNESGENLTYYARSFIDIGPLSTLASFFVRPLLQKIVRQDKQILEQQNKNIKKIPELHFFSDSTDAVGKELHAWLFSPDRRSRHIVNFEVYW